MMLEQELMRMLAISTCVALMMQAAKMGWKADKRSDLYRRLQPLVAMVLGVGLGYLVLQMPSVADRLLWGMIAGGFSSGGYGIVNAFVRGAAARAQRGDSKVADVLDLGSPSQTDEETP